MTPHLQLNRHNPALGEYGDCFRTAIACLLDLPPAEVPHFTYRVADGEAADAAARAWLACRGLSLITVPFDGEIPLAELLPAMAQRSGAGVRFILGGASWRGIMHVVIASPAGVEHDPMGGDPAQALQGPAPDGHWWIWWLGALV